MIFSYYTNKNIQEVFEELKTSPSGISEAEALLRQKKYGYNELSFSKTSILDIIVRQSKSPFFYLLIIAITQLQVQLLLLMDCFFSL